MAPFLSPLEVVGLAGAGTPLGGAGGVLGAGLPDGAGPFDGAGPLDGAGGAGGVLGAGEAPVGAVPSGAGSWVGLGSGRPQTVSVVIVQADCTGPAHLVQVEHSAPRTQLLQPREKVPLLQVMQSVASTLRSMGKLFEDPITFFPSAVQFDGHESGIGANDE